MHESSLGVSSLEPRSITGAHSPSGEPAATDAAAVGGKHAASACQVAEVGTFRWMAPEVARRNGFRRPADVYSFGMVLFELVSHELPFADLPALHAIGIVTAQGARPPMPDGTPPAISQLIQSCWAERPSVRPTFAQIRTSLAGVDAGLGDAERLWLDEPGGHPVYSVTEEGAAAAREGPKASSESSLHGTEGSQQWPCSLSVTREGSQGASPSSSTLPIAS